MTKDDYLTVLLNGYVKYPEYLPDYLYREYKEANKKFISYQEFFDGLREAINLLFQIIQKQDFKRKQEVGQIKEMLKAKGLPTADLDNDSTNHSVNLYNLTGGVFYGHLFGDDILKLSVASLKAVQKLQCELEEKPGNIESKDKTTPNKSVKPKESKQVFKTLSDAAVSIEAEAAIYKLLIKAGLIDADTKYVTGIGNNMGYFINTIEDFFPKGYLLRKPKNSELLNICNNTFKLNTSMKSVESKGARTKNQGCLIIPAFTLND